MIGSPVRRGFTATQRRDLMEIVEERYGRGSIMITSQLPITAWHDVIGEPTFADAILDRVVHNALPPGSSGFRPLMQRRMPMISCQVRATHHYLEIIITKLYSQV